MSHFESRVTGRDFAYRGDTQPCFSETCWNSGAGGGRLSFLSFAPASAGVPASLFFYAFLVSASNIFMILLFRPSPGFRTV